MGEPTLLELFVASSIPVLKILLICSIGALCAHKGLLTPEGRRVLGALSFLVFNPALNFVKLASTLTPARLLHWWPLVLNTGISTAIGLGLGWLGVRLVRPVPYLRSHTVVAIALGNVGNLPLVIVSTLASSSAAVLHGIPADRAEDLAVGYVVVGLLVPCIAHATIGFSMLRKPYSETTVTVTTGGGNNPSTHHNHHSSTFAGAGADDTAPGPTPPPPLPAPANNPSTSTTAPRATAPPMCCSTLIAIPLPAGPSSSTTTAPSCAASSSSLSAPGSLAHRRRPQRHDLENTPLLTNPDCKSDAVMQYDATPLHGTTSLSYTASRPPLLPMPRAPSAASLMTTGGFENNEKSDNHDKYINRVKNDDTSAGGKGGEAVCCRVLGEPCARGRCGDPGGCGSVGCITCYGTLLATSAAVGGPAGVPGGSLASPGSSLLVELTERVPLLQLPPPHYVDRGHHHPHQGPGRHPHSYGEEEEDDQGAKERGGCDGGRCEGRGGPAEDPPLKPQPPTSTSTSTSPHLNHPHHTLRAIARTVWKEATSPPLLAILLSVPVGCIRPLQRALFDPGAPLALVASCLAMLGDCTVPAILILLGATLANGPGGAYVPLRVTALVSTTRLLLLPLLGLGLVMGAYAARLFEAPDPIYLLVLLIQNTAPTAIMVHTMASVQCNRAEEISSILFWGYMAGILVIPLWLTAFLYVVQQGFRSAD